MVCGAGRRPDDISYIMYLVKRGMVEHHDCRELMCFHLLLLRFVQRDVSAANSAEKSLTSLEGHKIDFAFLLYAVQRCSAPNCT
jgi:hypothetical protein